MTTGGTDAPVALSKNIEALDSPREQNIRVVKYQSTLIWPESVTNNPVKTPMMTKLLLATCWRFDTIENPD